MATPRRKALARKWAVLFVICALIAVSPIIISVLCNYVNVIAYISWGHNKTEMIWYQDSTWVAVQRTKWEAWPFQARLFLRPAADGEPRQWVGMDVSSDKTIATIRVIEGEYRSGFEQIAPDTFRYYVATVSAVRISYYHCLFMLCVVTVVWRWRLRHSRSAISC